MGMVEEALPLLTVVVPIYGVEEYLRECIESIVNQKYNNLEIILVDDGSKGLEGKICDEYAENDSRIRVIHKENEGLIAARKTGINAATAEYITFVDGDDFIDNTYYSDMMAIAVKEKPDLIAVSLTQYYSEQQSEILLQHMESGVYERENLISLLENVNCKCEKYYDSSIFPSTCLKIYKRELLKKSVQDTPDNIRLGEDSAFTFHYIFYCQKIVVDNSIIGYHYRILNNSMSGEFDPKLFLRINDLYTYLKPSYEKSGNRRIKRQLELHRIYLFDIALDRLMSRVKLADIHKQCKTIKEYALTNRVFDDVNLEEYNLPNSLAEKLSFIVRRRWLCFELLCIEKTVIIRTKYIVKKIIKHR